MQHYQSGISLPKKRTDGESLEENLTENAYYGILPARYLKKDEDGNPVEEQEELFERVGKNIAVAEAVYHPTEVYIDHSHIKPDHPRRDELIESVFFTPQTPTRNNPDPDTTADLTELTEENAKYVSYDELVDDVSDGVRERMEEWKERYTESMERLKFIPNTPTLINAGSELQQLSACFVNSPEDDIDDIHETAREAALTFQSGGGMGYSFSHLRPYGDTVGSTGGIASGPITFMRTYDQLCETIAQGGARRGAQMGVMKVTHPDIPYFIHAKNKDVSLAETLRLNDPDDPEHNEFGEALEEARELIRDDGKVPKHLRNAVEGHLSNFNISVGITDDFMDAFESGEEFELTNPRTGEAHVATEETVKMYDWFGLGEYVEVGEPVSLPAEELWTRIVEGAYENGEPGVVFLDRMNKKHSFDVEENPEYEIHATNPCSEQPLMEYEACNLGHINLSTLVSEDAPDWRQWDNSASSFSDEVKGFLNEAVNWSELDSRIRVGTRFLDNVVTMSDFPVEDISNRVSQFRKIGLGIMGYHQMIIQMGIEYGSEEGNEVARYLMKYINHQSKQVSRELAEERGSFDAWEDSKYADPTGYPEWFDQHVGHDPEMWEEGFPIRNHNTTTIAPTGTTSMVGNTTGGCEPIYNVAYYKNVSDDVQGDEMLVEFDDYFLRVLRENGIDVESVKEQAKRQMANNEFEGISGLDEVPNEISELFITASQLSAREHADVLCAFQEGVDSAISKTINAPNDATLEEAKDVFEYIYGHGGKSVTFYRDGTRSKQVITTRKDNQDLSEIDEEKINKRGVAQNFLEEEYGVTLEEVESLVSLAGSLGDGENDENGARGGSGVRTDGGDDSDGNPMCDRCGVPMEVSEGCEKCPECGSGQCSI
jgi:ribonucleoside-diphosphate reductase alpha chain